MAWKSTLTPLRNRLATLYPREEDARRVVDEVELNPAHIAFNSQAINNWHTILTQADLQDKVQALVWVALGPYRTDQPLIDAYKTYMAELGRPATLPPAPATSEPPVATTPTTDSPPQVTQHVGTIINTGGGPYIGGDVDTGGGNFTGRDSESHNPQSAGPVASNQTENLQTLLAQRENNLFLLRKKEAVYAAGEMPLSLMNQIASEEAEIAKLKAGLDLLDENTAPAQNDRSTEQPAPRSSRVTAMKRKRLQADLEDLERQYEATDRELRTNTDPLARDRLQLRLTQLEEDMAKAEAALEALG